MTPVILVIDDSLVVRRILESSLTRAGLCVVSFPDGITAMRALSQGAAPLPDLLLLDVDLPRLDGYALARRFRATRPFAKLPILLFSGHTRLVDKLRGRLAGATAYLTKPFRPADVLAAIHRYLPDTPRPPGAA
jgi:twitching motility two-component system response regulator PilG